MSPFCDPVSRQSSPHWSMGQGEMPTAEMPSAMSNAPLRWAASANSRTGCRTPTEVSETWTSTPRASGCDSRASSTSEAFTARPHSTGTEIVSRPWDSAMCRQRSPK